MSLKLNPAVLALARQTLDRTRERLARAGVILDPRVPVIVRGMRAIHCNHHRHSDQDHHDLAYAPEWKALRAKVVADRGAKCESCGNRGRLAVHHRHYFRDRRVWEYEEADLLVLCKACHSIVHDRIETAEHVIYYGICLERLLEVERELKAEELEWEIDRALGYHDDPTLAYDEDNPGYWEEWVEEDPGLTEAALLQAEMEAFHDTLEDD